MFSSRTPAPHGTNRLAAALARRTRPYLDLTVTNPTAVGLAAPEERVLSNLAAPEASEYVPDPKGLLRARKAVAGYYARHGTAADPARIFLTASSSEAYGWLFKLLCEPGDAVLVPAPSYPLLDALAELESVELHRYPLAAEEGWAFRTDFVRERLEHLAGLGKRVKAVVVVNPNNPTGTSLTRAERPLLFALARQHGCAIVSDEVFLDYRLEELGGDATVAADHEDALVFSLGGLSKAAALPQMKLAWILANGPEPLLPEALDRLEWIADAYLSVGTPVQLAAETFLDWAIEAARSVRTRLKENLAALAEAFPEKHPARPLPVRAGWSAVLRAPAIVPEEELVLALLEDHDLLVHPGYFFDFPFEAFLVLSLLPEPALFREGVNRLARVLPRREGVK